MLSAALNAFTLSQATFATQDLIRHMTWLGMEVPKLNKVTTFSASSIKILQGSSMRIANSHPNILMHSLDVN